MLGAARIAVVLLAAAATWASAQPAKAQVRLVLFNIEGPGGARAREATLRVLRAQGVTLTPQRAVVATLSRLGGSAEEPAALAQAARTLEANGVSLSGFVLGRARNAEGGVVVEMRVVDRGGVVRGTASFRARRAADTGRVMRAELWAELGAAIEGLDEAPSDPATEADDPTPAAREEPRSDGVETADSSGDEAAPVRRLRPRGDPRIDTVSYYAYAGLVTRRLTFTDDLFDALGEYTLGVAAAVGTGGVYFPLHGLVDSPVANLGVEWAIARVTVDQTRNQAGTRFDTEAWSWQTGLRYDWPVGDRLLLSGALGLGRERFDVEPAGPTTPDGVATAGVPSVRYTYLRLAAGVRVRIFGALFAAATVGYRPVVSLGQLGNANWFPRARANGYELSGYAAYRVHPVMELRLMVEHRRYVSALRPRPGDQRVAGGSVDAWTNVHLGVVVTLPGAW